MKSKPQSSKAWDKMDSQHIRCAYDLKAERKNCKSAAMQSQIVIAWMEGHKIVHAPVGEWKQELGRTAKRREIYQRWIEQSSLDSSAPLTSDEIRISASDCVQCLIASGGAGWSIWKYQEVLRTLIHGSGDSAQHKIEWIPAEFTHFDPDKAPDVWLKENDEAAGKRCLDYGKEWLREAARIFELCVRSIKDFELIYENPTHFRADNKTTLLVDLLKNCVQAIDRLFYIVSIQAYHSRNPMDIAVALRQGFMMGKWLMKAEALVSNTDAMQLASRQGISGQHPSVFWNWILTQPCFARKSAKEIFAMLNGKKDPAFPNMTMTVTPDNKLRRGDGSYLLQSSFSAGLSRARKTMSQKRINT